jgi:hypothetical protein
MAFDGNGNFNLIYNWETDKANGIKIRADRMDAQESDIATGLSTAICKDGQTTITANLPMANFKHTGVGDATARTQYLSMGQAQDNGGKYFTATGTIDSYVLTPSPAITARTPGLSFFVRIPTGKTSTSATPVMAISGVFTATICNADGSQLNTGDLAGDGVYQLLDQGTVGLCLINKQGAGFSDTYTSGATGTIAWSANLSARQFVYPSTAGMSMQAPTATHGKYILLVKEGPYDLNIWGTINGVAGTITITDQQTLPLTYTTVDGVT